VVHVDSCVSRLNAAAMEVVARQLRLPKSYGTPHRVLTWEEVEQKLVESKTYWLATTRPDGRPHSVPVDGIWWEGALYFGGDPATVHMRNLRFDPRAVVHTESGESPVIAEGTAEWRRPSQAEISGLAGATQAKYGYPASPDSFRAGTWRLSPGRVLAWNVLYQDATGFTLAGGPAE
jgi:Pyridoxamine 5'-phosphate oxidase